MTSARVAGLGAASPDPVRIVGVGAGPAGIMILERLLANHRRDDPHIPLDIRLVDPYEPGGGRIWRRTQSPLLKLNTMLRDDAVFTDPSCAIEGPVVPGPSLAEWIAELRAGRIARPDWWDATLEAEVREATAESFPTRRLNNAYLSWSYGEIVRRAAPSASVRWHEDRVLAVDDVAAPAEPGTGGSATASGAPAAERGAGGYRVRLASGTVLDADIVVHAVGHNGSQPSGEARALGDFARRNDLAYVAPAFTADVDLDWVPAGRDVIVRGMGLAAVDLVVLLAEGRGGTFERVDASERVGAADDDASGAGPGRLVYRPSGREPVLHLGSRRGVPYRSKITSAIQGDEPQLDYVAPGFHERLAEPGALDFARDVWPLLCAEFVTGYYRELFTGHPDRVATTWEAFRERLRPILAAGADPARHGDRFPGLTELVRETVPDPRDRFDLRAFDRPLEVPEPGAPPGADALPRGVTDDTVLQDRLRSHLAEDLRLRTRQEHSATQGLFMAALFSYLSIAEVPTNHWNARSRTRLLPKSWHTYFSYLASGPPGHRLEELIALSEAGIVHFLGGNVVLETDEPDVADNADDRNADDRDADDRDADDRDADDRDAAFIARGMAVAGERLVSAQARAGILIDAWLPDASAAASDNPLLAQLVASGQARELAVADAEHSGSTGQLAVDASGRLPGTRAQFAMGPFTATPTGGAFTRPGLNSLPFRLNDRMARAVLAQAAQLVDCPRVAAA